MAITNSSLEEVRIGVRLKISALWIAMLFLYAYGDIFGFFRRGVIEDVIAGEISGIEITQTFLFRGLGLHRGRERDGLPDSRPQAEAQPVGQHRFADSVHSHYRGLGRRGGLGVLLLPEHCGELCPPADHLVRVDVAQAGNEPSLTSVESSRSI